MLAAGMGKGTRVGLYFTYGQEWVVAWLAASRIGALVMPLATTYRPAEIRKVLRIGDIDTLITARAVLGHDMQQMLEASVPGLADADRPAAASSRRRRRCAASGSPATPTGRWATPSTSTRPPADADAVTDDALRAVEAEVVPGRPRAGHLHVGVERRPEGRRAHARHRRARDDVRSPRCRTAGDAPPAGSSARSRSSGSAAR